MVLATPIAETSLTIEGVKTVIDSGLCKTLVYDPRNGMSHLETVRISLDMAKQRSGRAGRTTDGTCYRLWSKATELRMDDCRQPEIEQADLSSTLLDISAWGEDDIMDMPWLTPPPSSHAMQARQLLTNLGALDHDGHITPHGRQLALLPCHPRIAQMLIMAADNKTKALAADIAALLEEKDILTDEFVKKHGVPDVMIIDPPRAGMHEDVVKVILNAEPKRIVYVSCNPATQARDLAMLDAKYKVTEIQPVDMFPHTQHVENVVGLDRRF